MTLHSTKYTGIDWMLESEANELERRIREYWEKAGFKVKTRIENSSRVNAKTAFVIRSDMVNGLPRVAEK